MEFRLLGPLQISADGHEVAIGAERLRAVLAILLLDANRVVPTDRIADCLWDGEPPDGSRTSVRTYISQLRKLLRPIGGDTRIVTSPPGYLVRVEPGELDLHRFEAGAAAGRAELAADDPMSAAITLRAALAIWRGAALVDVGSSRCLVSSADRIEQTCIATIEDRIDADLAIGEHHAAVADLEALTAAHPLRERFWQQLIVALYRGGRQADALRAYQRVRAELADTLGIEPSPDLRALETAVLQQDPALDLPLRRTEPEAVATTTSAVADAPLFVGRGDELAQLQTAWDRARSGARQLVLVAGEPGIGKTALCAHFAARLSREGAGVVSGRCPNDAVVPYQPIIEALRAHVRSVPVEDLRAHLGAGTEALARLVPELDDGSRRPDPIDADTARYRLFDAVSSVLAHAAGQRPTLVLLDDLQWADTSTLLLLDHVLRTDDAAPLLLVGTYRDTDLSPQHPLADLLATWRRQHLAERLHVGGLTVPDVAELVAEAAGVDDLEAAASVGKALHDDTEGNAFFVHELLIHLREVGALGGDAPLTAIRAAEVGLPESVREVIGRRLSILSAACQRAMAAAAVVGAEFDADVVQRVLDLDEDAILDALDEAASARIISEREGTVGRYAFAHVLVREVLYDGLSAIRRARLHRRVADALDALRHNGSKPIAALAHHYLEAAPGGDVEPAVVFARRAATLARDQLAYEDAVRVLERALELLEDPGTDREDDRLAVLLELGEARSLAGDAVGAQSAFSVAVDVARTAGATVALAHAVLGLSETLGGYAITVRQDTGLTELLEEALDRLGPGDDSLRARLLARLAVELYYTPETERRSALGDEAVRLARAVGDPHVLLEALSSRTWATIGLDVAPEVRLAQADEVLALADRLGDGRLAYRTHFLRQQTLLEVGDLAAADAAGDAAARVAEELQLRGFLPWVAAYRAMRLAIAGDYDGADEGASAALDQALAYGTDPEVAMAVVGGQLMALRVFRGGAETFEEPMREMAANLKDHPAVGSWMAALYCELDRPDDAAAALDGAMARLPEMPRDATWLVSAWGLAFAASHLEDGRHASVLYEALTPYADRWCSTTSTIFLGPVELLLGMLARATGDLDVAERHLTAALDGVRRIPAPAFEAVVRTEHARALLQLGASSDGERAAAMLGDAAELCAELGLHLLGQRVAALRAG